MLKSVSRYHRYYTRCWGRWACAKREDGRLVPDELDRKLAILRDEADLLD
jgi:hypothetical protein